MSGKKPTAAAGKAPSQRMLRVGEMLRHKMSDLLNRGEIHDEVLSQHIITVPEVRLSPDLKMATVFVITLNGHGVNEAIAALERNKKYIRGELARAVNLKYAPDVRFKRDETFEEAARIDKLLSSDRIRRDVENK
jgi:ribosome-binding factor A